MEFKVEDSKRQRRYQKRVHKEDGVDVHMVYIYYYLCELN